MTYHVRLNENGAVELPHSLLAELGVHAGDVLTLNLDGTGGLTVKTHAQIIAEGQQAFRAMLKEPFSVDDFLGDRRQEAERD